MNQQNAFAEFAQAEFIVESEIAAHGIAKKANAIIRKTSRIETRRAKTEAVLLEILPTPMEMGTSYHVISHGDVDALSYLIHLSKSHAFETVLISTWCMAMPDLEWLRQQIENGRIGRIDFCLGEIFPSQYPDEYLTCQAMVELGDATLKIARNHAKVMAGASPRDNIWFAIESSSNVNTNPRIEQTAVHMSRELHDFYRDFYAGIQSIDGARYVKPKRRTAP